MQVSAHTTYAVGIYVDWRPLVNEIMESRGREVSQRDYRSEVLSLNTSENSYARRVFLKKFSEPPKKWRCDMRFVFNFNDISKTLIDYQDLLEIKPNINHEKTKYSHCLKNSLTFQIFIH